MALLICADAIAADDRGYLPLIRRLRPDLLLVVSMTPETPPFEAFAEEMARYWIGSVFVNAHCVCQPPRRVGWLGRLLSSLGLRKVWPQDHQTPSLAACDLALYEADGCPPTRVRWRLGQDEPECFFFKTVDGIKGWRGLSQTSGRTGVSLLTRGGERLGLVLDLGVHWE